MPSKYYAVKVGKSPGIYLSWSDAEKHVKGYPGAVFKSFTSLEDAKLYMSSSVSSSSSTKEVDIYCDGGCNKQTGEEGWGSVVNSAGSCLVTPFLSLFPDIPTRQVQLPVGKRTILVAAFNNVSSQQNNGAELLALIAALRIAKAIGKPTTIGCDSAVVLSWSQGGKNKDHLGVEKAAWITYLQCLRKEHDGEIIKISGDDNLADLGYHK